VLTVLGQLKEVVTVAGNHHPSRLDGMGKDFLVVAGNRECVLKNNHVVTVSKQRVGDRTWNIVIEQESHSAGAVV